MLASSTKSYSNLSSLVGGTTDARSDIFAKLFLAAAPSSGTSINDTAADIKKPEHTRALDFMKAQNYTTKTQNMGNTEIVHEFTDFIVQIALFHREIDTVSKISDLYANFKKYTGTAANQDMWDNTPARTMGFGTLVANDNLFNLPPANTHLTGNTFFNTFILQSINLKKHTPVPQLTVIGNRFMAAGGMSNRPGQVNLNGLAGVTMSTASDRLLRANFAISNNIQRLLAILLGFSYTKNASQEIIEAVCASTMQAIRTGYTDRGNNNIGVINANAVTAVIIATAVNDLLGLPIQAVPNVSVLIQAINVQAAGACGVFDAAGGGATQQQQDAAYNDIMTPITALANIQAMPGNKDAAIDAIFPANGNAGFPALFLDGVFNAAQQAAQQVAPQTSPTEVFNLLVHLVKQVEANRQQTFVDELKVEISTKMRANINDFMRNQSTVAKITNKEPSEILAELERDNGPAARVLGVTKGTATVAAPPLPAYPNNIGIPNLYDAFADLMSNTLIDAIRAVSAKFTGINTTRATTRPVPVAAPAAAPAPAVPAPAPAVPAPAPALVRSDALDVLWDGIYDKWNTLTTREKGDVNAVLRFQKKTANGPWTDIQDNDMGKQIPLNEYGNYRINLYKGATMTDKCPTFSRVLPKFDTAFFGSRIWYTSTNNGIQSFDITNMAAGVGQHLGFDVSTTNNIQENIFRLLYCAVFRQDPVLIQLVPGVTLASFQTQWQKNLNKPFSINVSKFIRRRLFEIKKNKGVSQQQNTTLINMADKNIWLRNANGKLVRKDPNGVEVEYGNNAAGDSILEGANKCYTTLLNTQAQECDKYMSECLLSGDPKDVQECLNFWKRQDFYTVAKEEINKMHPLIALKTLTKFGFKQVRTTVNGRPLLQVQGREDWIKSTLSEHTKTLTGATGEDLVKIITDNSKLLDYLQLLSEYVNGNPAILNKGYVAPTQTVQGTFVQTDVGKKLFPEIASTPKSARFALGSYARNNYRKIKQPSSLSPFSSSGLKMHPAFLQQGGTSEIPPPGYIGKRLKELLNSAFYELENNKKIVVSDKSNIMNMIDTLLAIEDELEKTYIYIDAVANTKDLFGDQYPEVKTLKEVEILYSHITQNESKQKDLATLLTQALEKLSQTNINMSYNSTVVSGDMEPLNNDVFN